MSYTCKRLWEVDTLRGVAIVMMVIYHLFYDLYYFRVTDTIFTNPFWFYFQRTTAGTFLVLGDRDRLIQLLPISLRTPAPIVSRTGR